MRGKREPAASRFWQFVEQATDEGACWEWQGAVDKVTGYGKFKSGDGQRTVSAHRFAHELMNGPLPIGRWALHKCDNRKCVNPAHLYEGNRSDNMRDAYNRGRIDLRRVRAARNLAA